MNMMTNSNLCVDEPLLEKMKKRKNPNAKKVETKYSIKYGVVCKFITCPITKGAGFYPEYPCCQQFISSENNSNLIYWLYSL